jgi:hypothetical protein
MLELWVLVWVSLTDPVSGAWVDNFGMYQTHDECIYAMREAEIMINRVNEGMLCLQFETVPYRIDGVETEESWNGTTGERMVLQ